MDPRSKPETPTPIEQQRPAPVTKDEEPPVVARLVVEIRSDGSRTIARGGIEDLINRQRVAVEARGSTPMSLALALAKSLMQTPALARQTVRALLDSRTKFRK